LRPLRRPRSRSGDHDELAAPVGRVRLPRDETALLQVVDDRRAVRRIDVAPASPASAFGSSDTAAFVIGALTKPKPIPKAT
jgi:hypothetical protein